MRMTKSADERREGDDICPCGVPEAAGRFQPVILRAVSHFHAAMLNAKLRRKHVLRGRIVLIVASALNMIRVYVAQTDMATSLR